MDLTPMNQSQTNQGQASSQDKEKQDKDKNELASGEFVYEFFQPVFESSSFDYQFTSELSVAAPAPAPPVSQIQLPIQPVLPAAPVLPPSVSSLIETAFAAAETSVAETVVEAAETAEAPETAETPAAEADTPAPAPNPTSCSDQELQAQDDSGATIFYGRWNIMPHRIRYCDRSIAEFEYDETEQLIRVKDRNGIDWIRTTEPDHRNIATWRSTDDETCDMSMVMIPDGTYQCTSAAGAIQTCTLTGRIVVWTPFTYGFDLKRTLFAIFRRVDANQDSGLSKEELELASRQIWKDPDAIQLIKMLQAHYDAICSSRRHALCRQGSGITIDDILAFDAATQNEQESRCTAPPHLVTRVRSLFDELNTTAESVVTIHQVRIAYNKRHERDSVSRAILKTIYEELVQSCDTANNSFASKASNLTRSDLVQAYKDGYKRELRGRIKIAGWGTDECLPTGETSTRTLYVDPSNPLESILPQAIRQLKPDPATAEFRSVLEALTTQCPHLVVRMIAPTSDGRFNVSFAGLPQKTITVAAPDQNALAVYLHGCKFGFWMAILEEAYKQYEVSSASNDDRDHIEKIERIFRLLLGQNGKWIKAKDVPLPDLGIAMRDAFKQRRVMISVGLQNSPRVAGHKFVSRSAVCGIINFDHKNGRVTISDPLRENGQNNVADPLELTPDGSVLVSLSAFSAAFDKIYVEDWQPTDDMFQK
jgi:hypothetical protein